MNKKYSGGEMITIDLRIQLMVDFNFKPGSTKTMSGRSYKDQSTESIERFWLQWIGAEDHEGRRISMIEGMPVGPCRSSDLYDLYKAWCQRFSIAKPAAKRIMLANVSKRADCGKAVERYYVGSTLKQATFIYPKCSGVPDIQAGKTKPAWLTECAGQFVDGIKAWRGSRNAD